MKNSSIRIDDTRCAKCGLCVGVCPMNILLLIDEVEIKGECIDCEECIIACPEEAINKNEKDRKVESL